MIELKGKYTDAVVYQNEETVEPQCIEQIRQLLDSPAYEGCKVRIMPDCHTGVSAPIGTTIAVWDRVIPNTVSVDIGCGMYLVMLKGIRREDVDFQALDTYIRENVPAGREIHRSAVARMDGIKELRCFRELRDTPKFEKALGTLGGGNHFQEIDEDDDGDLYYVVHTGSRNLGKQVADHYQNLADGLCNRGLATFYVEKDALIARYKEEGRKSEIQNALVELKRRYQENRNLIPKDLAYLEGPYLEDYFHDMGICQEYARLNRETIARTVCRFFGLDWDSLDRFETVHNYIDLDQRILRKGAIDCSKGRRVLIPINMRDGSIIAVGKGNPDYNFSGPHGAGRLMSRGEARRSISLDDFKRSMEGVFSTCINERTLDESAFAYKSMDDILPWIQDTCEVERIIRPVYNFKADD